MRLWLSRLGLGVSCIGALAAAAWTIAGWTAPTPTFATAIGGPVRGVTGGEGDDPAQALSVPDAALTVTLYDDLHPEPPALEAPEPKQDPPRLDVRVVAIRQTPAGRTAFVHDATAEAYLELAPGDTLGSGALVREVTASAVIFEHRGRTITVELPRR